MLDILELAAAGSVEAETQCRQRARTPTLGFAVKQMAMLELAVCEAVKAAYCNSMWKKLVINITCIPVLISLSHSVSSASATSIHHTLTHIQHSHLHYQSPSTYSKCSSLPLPSPSLPSALLPCQLPQRPTTPSPSAPAAN